MICGGVGAAGAAEIILYGRANFQGQSVTLTQSAPDLRNYNFDNDLESFRVISGSWRIHRDANYQDNSGPSLTVGPGSYPDIRELRDNEDVRYPGNRMSSVRLIVDPVAASFPPPYQTPNPDGMACTFVCGSGTVPDRASGECVCQRGWAEVGTDNQGRRVCRRQQVPPPDDPVVFEPPPLLQAQWVRTTAFDINERRGNLTLFREVTLGANVATSDQLAGARLMYRAIEGPRVVGNAATLQLLANAPWLPYREQYARLPYPIQFRISAGAGIKYVYFQVRAQTMGASGGAWIASAPSADNILYEPNVAEAPVETPTAAIYNVPAGAAFTVARANGFSFNAGRQSSDGARHCTYQTMTDGALGLNVTYEGPNNLDSTLAYLAEGGVRLVCYFRMFGSRQLAAGWSFFGRTDYEPGVCGVGKFEFRPYPVKAGRAPWGCKPWINWRYVMVGRAMARLRTKSPRSSIRRRRLKR